MAPTPRGKITVYRFRSTSGNQVVSPQRMWGTPEAIATLPQCEVIPESGRLVHRKLLEEGFFFEQVNSAYIAIDEAEGNEGASAFQPVSRPENPRGDGEARTEES